MTTNATTDERLSYLEGVYEHVATKADLAALETRLRAEISAAEARLNDRIAALETRVAGIEGRVLRGIIPTIIASLVGGIGLGMGVAAAVARLVS